MMSKLNDILHQFSKEMDIAVAIFEAHRAEPPLTRNQPPVAGAIKWSRSLFARVKHTMNKLLSMEVDIRGEEAGRDVHEKYMGLARMVMVFERGKFKDWAESADSIAMHHLKQPMLRRDGEAGRISVNFHNNLTQLMRETRYLDRMGFAIPEVALNVALQEDKYHQCVEALEIMLEHYYQVLSMLTPVERSLMSQKLRQLELVLGPGFSPLNWNSLGISDFVASCNKKINEFQSLVNQVQKNSSIIEKVVTGIANAKIVTEPPEDDEVMDLQEFYEHIEKHRIQVADHLVKKYRTISPLLGKVEEAVCGTNTGKSALMASYYDHWEGLIFQALNSVVLSSMTGFLNLVNKRKGKKPRCEGGKPKAPLFKVSMSLRNPEVVVQPPISEVNKLLGRLVKNLVETTKPFLRWMRGTCTEAPPQQTRDDEEPYVFTFYWDVAANPQ
ncbi:unnamed protein product, partial [Ostreobium quekettii]